MRPIRWLHVSDLHLRESEIWSQDAVLAAMLDDIQQRVEAGTKFDFALITGDLAYSGQDSEYALVESFIDDLIRVIGVTRGEIFCVAGNHDVDRSVQTMCFSGARQNLRSEADVYTFLSNEVERETLLTRLQAFQEFHRRYFAGQDRPNTDEGLAYTANMMVDDLRIAVIGLNSAWLAEGGRSDHGQILLGECQVSNAIEAACQGNSHIVIGMAHHPFLVLNEFDRPPTQRRLEDACHFYHSGHLHVPEAANVATQSGRCLTLAAGASFESRDSHNSYTIVTFDPLQAKTNVTFVGFDPIAGVFSFEAGRTYSHSIEVTAFCGIGELSAALEIYCPDAKDFCFYLSALLLDALADVPIVTQHGIAFGTVPLLLKQDDNDLQRSTIEFLAVGNAVKILFGDKLLEEILATNGEPVQRYVNALLGLAGTDPQLLGELTQRNEAARKFAGVDGLTAGSHTLALLQELREAGAWDELRSMAERHIGVDESVVSARSKRMLALCLARSEDRADRGRAASLYQELSESPEREAADFASLAVLSRDSGDNGEATAAVLRGIEAFPESAKGFIDIGMEIVQVTGDTALRGQLRGIAAGRRSR